MNIILDTRWTWDASCDLAEGIWLPSPPTWTCPWQAYCNLMFDTIAISSAICSRLIVFHYSALLHAFCSRDWLIVIDCDLLIESLTVICSEWITITGIIGITYALSCLSLRGFVYFVCLLALACGFKSVSLIIQCVLLKSVEVDCCKIIGIEYVVNKQEFNETCWWKSDWVNETSYLLYLAISS